MEGRNSILLDFCLVWARIKFERYICDYDKCIDEGLIFKCNKELSFNDLIDNRILLIMILIF